MSRIAIVSLAISSGDAVGNDALEMRRILSARGHTVGLFSSHWVKKSEQTRDVAELAAFLADDPQAILIYHHAIGWTAGLDLLRRTTCRRVVKYHNVTPGRFFAGFPGDAVRICQLGREQLRDLARTDCDLYLSDSPYNQGELIEAGAAVERCAVVPPFHHIDRLDHLQADPEVLRRLDDGRTNLLFVGRRVPNKGHRFLIDAFAVYHEHYDRDSRLAAGRQGRSHAHQLLEPAARTSLAPGSGRKCHLPRRRDGCGVEGLLRASIGVRDGQRTRRFLRAAGGSDGACKFPSSLMARRPCRTPSAMPDWFGTNPIRSCWRSRSTALSAMREVRRQLTERGWRRYQNLFANQRMERDFLHALRPFAA